MNYTFQASSIAALTGKNPYTPQGQAIGDWLRRVDPDFLKALRALSSKPGASTRSEIVGRNWKEINSYLTSPAVRRCVDTEAVTALPTVVASNPVVAAAMKSGASMSRGTNLEINTFTRLQEVHPGIRKYGKLLKLFLIVDDPKIYFQPPEGRHYSISGKVDGVDDDCVYEIKTRMSRFFEVDTLYEQIQLAFYCVAMSRPGKIVQTLGGEVKEGGMHSLESMLVLFTAVKEELDSLVKQLSGDPKDFKYEVFV